MVKKVVWDYEAMASFKEAIFYIKKDSLGRAEKVRVDILSMVRKLAENQY
jgi:plasmid stabilization system protein ParE